MQGWADLHDSRRCESLTKPDCVNAVAERGDVVYNSVVFRESCRQIDRYLARTKIVVVYQLGKRPAASYNYVERACACRDVLCSTALMEGVTQIALSHDHVTCMQRLSSSLEFLTLVFGARKPDIATNSHCTELCLAWCASIAMSFSR